MKNSERYTMLLIVKTIGNKMTGIKMHTSVEELPQHKERCQEKIRQINKIKGLLYPDCS